MVLLFFACSAEVEPLPETRTQDPSVVWTELSDEDLEPGGDKDSGWSDSGWGKEDECGPEVVYGEDCDGDWENTLCVDDDGEYWWCEDAASSAGQSSKKSNSSSLTS